MSTTVALSEEIDKKNLEAWNIVRTDPAHCLKLAREAFAEAKEVNYAKGIAWAEGNIGSAYIWLSEYDKALEHNARAIELLEAEKEEKQLVQILYSMSIIFYFLMDFDQQVYYTEQSLALARKIGDQSGEANALNGLGTAFYSHNRNEEAIDVLSTGLEIALEIDDKTTLGKIYDGLGQAHLHLGNLIEASDFKLKSLEVVTLTGNKQVQSFAHDGLGEIYTRLGDYSKAIEHLDQALVIRSEMGFKGGVCESTLHKGLVYLEAGDNLNCVQFFKQGLQIAESLNSNELRYKAHDLLAKAYEKMGNMSLFVEHFKAYHQFKQAHSEEKEGKKVRAFELKGKLEQIQKEKEILEEKNIALSRYFEDVEILSAIGNEITSAQSLDDIFDLIYESINKLMQAQGIFIGICDKQNHKIRVELAIDNGKRDKYFEYSMNDFTSKLPVYCVKKATAIHINEYSKEVGKYLTDQESLVREPNESVILLPLVVHEEVLGVLLVQNQEKNAFSDHQFNLIKSFGTNLAIALDNASLIEEMEEKVKARTSELKQSYQNTETLNQIGQQLISTLNFEDVFETLYKNVNTLMDATIFGVRLLDKENDCVQYLYEYERGRRLKHLQVPMSKKNNYSVICIENDQTIVINNHKEEYSKYVNEVMVVDGEMPNSLIFYPLKRNDEVFGVISVQCFENNAYSDYHLNIVKTLAQYTIIAFDNARRYELMEEAVKERTIEISRSYDNAKLLGEIGKDITAQLTVEKIIEVVYERINQLMDAEGFGIGIYNETDHTLGFPGYIESGERLDGSLYPVTDENRLACVCFNYDREIVIDDFEEDHKKYIQIDQKPQVGREVTSLIYLPIRSKEKKIGVITVQSFEKNSYADYQVDMLRSIGVYIGIALENAQLYGNMEQIVKERTSEVILQKEEIENSYKNIRLISQISKDISQSLSIEDIIEKVYENVNTIMDATCFGIGLYNEEKRALIMPGFIEKGIKMAEFAYLIDDERLASWCFKNGKEIFVRNYMEEYDQYIKGVQAPVSGQDSTSIIYIPLFSKDKAVGVLTVQSFEKDVYTDYHMSILRGLAATIGSALENAILYANLEDKVHERTLELVEQKEIIEEKNKHITDSIRYAKRIQDATLPHESLVRSYLNDAFVLFKPKDIVSGDFYWVHRVDDLILFAVVDCTGHGVPGAFLSLIGHNSLNQIVNELNIYKPNEILNELNRMVYKTLRNSLEVTNIKDGMDMAICSLDVTTNELQFSGAYNPLYLVRNKEVIEIKGDKLAIGSDDMNNIQFTNNVIQLDKGDCIYMFSDGYADQFGGPKGKKFKYSQFKELLVNIHQKDMTEQQRLLNHMIEAWQGDLEQIDDICVIGYRN